jgi:hypothetical protein
MPEGILGKVVGGVYVAGYWLYILFAAIILWPASGFFTWLSFVGVHVMVATVWPIGALLWYVGYFTGAN